MLKKFTILGLVMLLAGSGAIAYLQSRASTQRKQIESYRTIHGAQEQTCLEQYRKWLTSDPAVRGALPFGLNSSSVGKTPGEMREQQRQRLLADLDHVSLEDIPSEYADILYGEGWQEYVEQYRQRQANRELAMTLSIAAASLGAVVSLWSVLILVVRGFLISSSNITSKLSRKKSAAPKAVENGSKKQTSDAKDSAHSSSEKDAAKPGKHSKVLEQSGWHGLLGGKGKDKDAKKKAKQKRKEPEIISETRLGGTMTDAERIGRAFSKRTFHPSKSLQAPPSSFSTPLSSQPHLAAPESDTSSSDATEDVAGNDAVPDSMENIEEKTTDIDNQLTQLKEMATTIQQSTKEYSKPLDTLNELSEQVSAIREYVAGQQHRVERLQDGYDWSIVRTFCLRFIRCIDNLETRIESLEDEEIDTSNLREVHDELLFALESSGVEQFSPDRYTEYRGCEKYAEAVKEREETDDPEAKGKIAQVIRPGYRYFIDEDNCRVVRSAQVKIFG